MNESRHTAVSMASAIAVVIIWSTTFSFAKDAIEHIGPWLFRCYSVGVGLLPLLPFLRNSIKDVFQLAPLQRRNLLVAVTLTGTVVATINMLALAYFPASSVLAMMYTMPAFAAILEAIRQRTLPRLVLAASATAVAGVLVYAGDSALGAGALLVLANAWIWALATSLSGRGGQPLKPYTAVTLQMTIAFLASLPMLLVNVLVFDAGLPTPTSRDLVGILYAGLLNGALVFWLWYYVIHAMGAVKASFFTLFVPMVGSVFAALFFGEALGPRELCGLALISASMVLQRMASRRQPR